MVDRLTCEVGLSTFFFHSLTRHRSSQTRRNFRLKVFQPGRTEIAKISGLTEAPNPTDSITVKGFFPHLGVDFLASPP
jgi:hypothetical protein